MDVQQLKQEVIPSAIDALASAAYGEETSSRSRIRSVEFSWNGESFRVIDQNTKKLDPRTGEPTRFAKLALNGHEVLWVIRERFGQWYLVVDRKPIKRSFVTNEGQILDGAEF